MSILLDHTIVHASDPAASGRFLAETLGLDPPRTLGPFTVVKLGETSLDFMAGDGAVRSRHFAFRVDEAEFDAIFARIAARGMRYWADPSQSQPGRINHWDDGRGVYFEDPDGHLLEIITRPYGSGGCGAAHPNPLLGCG